MPYFELVAPECCSYLVDVLTSNLSCRCKCPYTDNRGAVKGLGPRVWATVMLGAQVVSAAAWTLRDRVYIKARTILTVPLRLKP